MAGKFTPGQPSSIRGLASELGTSPIPVREALRRLVAEKAFEIYPNGSIVVPIMTRTRFHDLQRARILIEGFATELAAKSISEKDIAQLEKVHKQAVDAATSATFSLRTFSSASSSIEPPNHRRCSR